MNKFRIPSVLLILAMLFSFVNVSPAMANPAITTVPPGLNPGDHYRLVFVTDGKTEAWITDINILNNFGTDQANLSPTLSELGTTWKVIGSVHPLPNQPNDDYASTNSASTNIGVIDEPIFGLDGSKIADNSADLWDGSLDSGIRFTQTGMEYTGLVFTGTFADGRSRGFRSAFGSIFYNPTGTGLAGATTGEWIDGFGHGKSTPEPVYVISGVLTVPVRPAKGNSYTTWIPV